MYVGLKQPRGDGERYVTPARAAAKETRSGGVKAGFHLKTVLTSLNMAFVPISSSRFKQRKIPPYVLRHCVKFWEFFEKRCFLLIKG